MQAVAGSEAWEAGWGLSARSRGHWGVLEAFLNWEHWGH